ncbi:hypothetical protein A9Q99_13905 [Gammaproteobacteria bacterium 45_16_T64]|nr:hypothetical protein A9Q99_13905 [Gammaproteobacteria bacterium 45_16_T64]
MLTLSEDLRSLACEQKHSFDIAKQGYVNLLPVQQKKSQHPGDSKEMVLARKQFLGLGYYQPLVDALVSSTQQHLSSITSPVILDAGCGEGYYTDNLHRALAESNDELTAYGFDIAKPAVLEAAKRNRSICFFVSTIKAVPIAPHSCDVIISIFSPINTEQFQHMLKPGGKLIVLCAGKNHLHQLKSLLYTSTADYDDDKFLAPLDSHFTLSERSSIQHTMNLTSQHDIMSLLAMTPHFWRASPEAKQQLETINQLLVDIDVQRMIFTPKTLEQTEHE